MRTQKEVKQQLYTSLKELDLTEQEIELYAISLATGPAPVTVLAEHLGVSRPNVYKLIAGLERHGLANVSGRQRYSRTFVVEPPTAILAAIRKRREAVTDLDHHLAGVMPDLLTFYHQGAAPTKIRVLYGEEQYVNTFNQILDETREEIRFFGSAYDFFGLLSRPAERAWIDRRIEQEVRIRTLLLPGADAELLRSRDTQELRETRILSGMAPFVTSFHLFANKVILWQPKAPLALLIEDEYIVVMLRSIFERLWDASGPAAHTSPSP